MQQRHVVVNYRKFTTAYRRALSQPDIVFIFCQHCRQKQPYFADISCVKHDSLQANNKINWRLQGGNLNLSLQAKMGLSFLMGLVILLVVGITAWQANSKQIQNSALVTHTHQILTYSEGLISALSEAESTSRGYLISGNPDFLKPYQRITEDIEFQYRSLVALTTDSPEHQQRLFLIKPLIDQRLASLSRLIQTRQELGMPYVQQRFINGRGRLLQEEIHKQIDELEYGEQKMLVLRNADTEKAISHSRMAITLGTVCALLIVIASFLGLRIDISRRTEAENALKIANRKLAAATERAQHADNSKSAFLATMSHELRTPLNSIIGFSGVLLQELAGPLNAEQKKQLNMVRDSSRHLLALVNDVLDISKVEAGQLRIQHQTFNMREAITRSVALVTPLAAKKQLSVDIRVETELGQVINDRRRVEQVLINLLNNAIKFTEKGSVMLHAESLSNYIAPATSAPQAAIRIRVVDTGIGIDEKHLADLFTPFKQIEDGLARQHEGTGLGLAISDRLLSLMGGEISVSSKKHEGSTFTVIIPRHGIEPL
jgi:signal transduction histidine kinase